MNYTKFYKKVVVLFFILSLVCLLSISSIFASDLDNQTIYRVNVENNNCNYGIVDVPNLERVSDSGLDSVFDLDNGGIEKNYKSNLKNNNLEDFNLKNKEFNVSKRNFSSYDSSLNDNYPGYNNLNSSSYVSGNKNLESNVLFLADLDTSIVSANFNSLVINDNSEVSVFSSKEDCKIQVFNLTTSPLSGVNFTAKLTDSYANPLAGYELSFLFSNALGQSKTYWATTNTEGIAKVPINLAYASTYNMLVSYGGNSRYNPATSALAFILITNAKLTTISVSDLTTSVSSGESFFATLRDSSGNSLSGKQLSFVLTNSLGASVTYYSSTNYNGIASLAISLTYPGTYSVIVRFGGDGDYGSSSANAVINVVRNKVVTSVSFLSNSVVRGDYLYMSLSSANGNIMSGQTLNVTINAGGTSKTYYVVTDSSGRAALKLELIPANWDFTVAFTENNDYCGSTAHSIINVYMIDTVISLNNYNLSYGDNLGFILKETGG